MHRILVTAACCSLLSLTALAAVPLTPGGNGHLLVPAFIDGKGPYPVILDTGADISGVYAWFAKQQHLTPGPSEVIDGMTGSANIPTYALKRIEVDGRALVNVTVDSYPDRHDVERQVGVVGNDLMDGSVAVFDFPCSQVHIWPKPVDMATLLSPKARMLQAGVVKNGTQLTFDVTVHGVHGVAVLDTGSRDTRINSLFVRAAGLDPASSAFHDSETIYGANSKGMPSRKGPIGTVGFAGLEASNVQARVMDLPVFNTFGIGNGPAMIFGLDIMQGYRLVYDHDAKRFWFDESTCTPEHVTSR
ncbi:pepsin/retropepsin-like aspartic protease family protein [Dyella sp.]|uniref:pepsin/retropepsin-like aspartic protease family protein n=1 Tax=Dyella sp. TaxID=1869338 RepID=UPI00284BFF48|nr:pepsin/retropepsin-like aspartic protease family protein [Dyella sp.]MDR3447487.1 pepsin/retropepsin-like aspartic protease family protein [Dyella sp.]